MSQKLLKPEQSLQIINYLFDQYAISQDFWSAWAFVKTRRGIWSCKKEVMEFTGGLNIQRVGVHILSGKSFPYKPTDPFARSFGHLAKKRVFEISRDQVSLFFKGQEIDSKQIVLGYHLIKLGNEYLGVAQNNKGRLISVLSHSRQCHNMIQT